MKRQCPLPERLARVRVDALGDDPQHHQVGVVEPRKAGTETGAGARRPADIAHRMVTGLAIEKDQLGKDAFAAALGIEHGFQQLVDGDGLADGPGLDAVRHLLARIVVLVDLVVRRLDRGEGIELEAEPRVPGAHDPVGDEFLAVAEMTGQAEPRPVYRILRREHAGRHLRLAGGDARDMDTEPAHGAAMAGFAADTVGYLELLGA